MLAAIRRFAKSWFATVLFGLLIVSFVVFGIGNRSLFQRHASNAVITAGDRVRFRPATYKREFDRYKAQVEQRVGQPITPELAAANGLDRQVLQGVATREAFAALLTNIGLRPSDKLIAQEIQKIPAFFDPVSGRFDKKAFLRKLAENGLSPPAFDARTPRRPHPDPRRQRPGGGPARAPRLRRPGRDLRRREPRRGLLRHRARQRRPAGPADRRPTHPVHEGKRPAPDAARVPCTDGRAFLARGGQRRHPDRPGRAAEALQLPQGHAVHAGSPHPGADPRQGRRPTPPRSSASGSPRAKIPPRSPSRSASRRSVTYPSRRPPSPTRRSARPPSSRPPARWPR